jgi:hypothetical protein
MRTSGQVIGAPTTVATRTSVILSCEGSERRFTFWTAPSRSASVRRPKAEAPAAAPPADLKNARRSSWRLTAVFMVASRSAVSARAIRRRILRTAY